VSAGKNQIDVAAALIFRDGRILIAQRPIDSHLGGLWEFPGGKREPNETFEQCLVREIHEELGVIISVDGLFEETEHAYADKIVHLKFFICHLIHGDPKPLGCEALKWVGKPELGDFKFPDADAKLLSKLKDRPELFR